MLLSVSSVCRLVMLEFSMRCCMSFSFSRSCSMSLSLLASCICSSLRWRHSSDSCWRPEGQEFWIKTHRWPGCQTGPVLCLVLNLPPASRSAPFDIWWPCGWTCPSPDWAPAEACDSLFPSCADLPYFPSSSGQPSCLGDSWSQPACWRPEGIRWCRGWKECVASARRSSKEEDVYLSLQRAFVGEALLILSPYWIRNFFFLRFIFWKNKMGVRTRTPLHVDGRKCKHITFLLSTELLT